MSYVRTSNACTDVSNKAVINVSPCQPTEDEDVTVVDSAKTPGQESSDWMRADFDRRRLAGLPSQVVREPFMPFREFRREPNLNFIAEESGGSQGNVGFSHQTPIAATSSNVSASNFPAADLPSDQQNQEINLRSDHTEQSFELDNTNLETDKLKVCAAADPGWHRRRASYDRDRDENGLDLHDMVDHPIHGAQPRDVHEELAMLRTDYERILEKLQQFVISNVQLRDANEELTCEKMTLEKDVDEAKCQIHLLKSEKMNLLSEVNSLHKTLNVIRSQMPMVAAEAEQRPPIASATNGDNRCYSEEYTSSLREELRQTILLVMSQQDELQRLYKVMKNQNEMIRQLSQPNSSKARCGTLLPLPQQECDALPNKSPQSRHIPEGSSIPKDESAPVVDHVLPVRESKSGGSAVPLKNPIRRIFGPRIGKTSSSVVPSVAKSASQMDKIPERHALDTKPMLLANDDVKSAPRMEKNREKHLPDTKPMMLARDDVSSTSRTEKPTQATNSKLTVTAGKNEPFLAYGLPKECSVRGPPDARPNSEQGRMESDPALSDFDLEHSGFVLVDESQTETRVCPLCSTAFSSDVMTMEQFVDHVSQCNPPEEFKQCPVCFQKFDNKASETQILMHVNEHFDEDRFLCLSPTDAPR